jgi:hypothetical protein
MMMTFITKYPTDCLGNIIFDGDYLSADKNPARPPIKRVKSVANGRIVLEDVHPTIRSKPLISGDEILFATHESFKDSYWVRSNKQPYNQEKE